MFYCTLKLSHGHDCIDLQKFSLLALVVTGLLQFQDDVLICLHRNYRDGLPHSI